MKRTNVTDLTPDSLVRSTFLVQSKERKIASNGAPYLDLSLQDASGTIPAKLWDCDRFPNDFEVDDIVQVEGQLESFRGTAQVRIRKIARCRPEEVSLLDYLPHSQHDPEQMFAGLLERIRQMPDGPLRALLLEVMEDPAIAEKYKLAPAAMSYHHAYLGGLVEHVSSLVALADKVADHYPSLRRDLIIAGLVLHDIGKIQELSFGRAFDYTTRGRLVGHISIAIEIVHEKMRLIPDFPPSLRDQIEHIILAHHGKLEFGSPREPMFPEALVVHYLDDMDSKLESMRAQYKADRQRPGEWTGRNPALRRELFRPGEEAPEHPEHSSADDHASKRNS
jgi:3'-5' exoribonuclease